MSSEVKVARGMTRAELVEKVCVLVFRTLSVGEGFMRSPRRADYRVWNDADQSRTASLNAVLAGALVGTQGRADLEGELFQRIGFLKEIRFKIHYFVVEDRLTSITGDK